MIKKLLCRLGCHDLKTTTARWRIERICMRCGHVDGTP